MGNSMMAAPPGQHQDEQRHAAWRPWAIVGFATVAWWLPYNALQPLAVWITTSLLGLSLSSALGSAAAFFLFDVPLGVTFSFLISAPMVNEVAPGMLFGMFGWQVAFLYVATGLVVAIAAGLVIGRVPNVERGVEDFVWAMPAR